MHRYSMQTDGSAHELHYALHCSVTESKNPSRQMTAALRRAASHECEDTFAEVDAASSASTQ